MQKYLLAFLLFISTSLSAQLDENQKQLKILIFSGSTRDNSFNSMLAKEAGNVAATMGARVTLIDLRDFPLPLYEDDIEKKNGLPPNAKRFRQLLMDNDAVIIATPEYNGSVPGLLKNLIDWASRSDDAKYSRTAFLNKKFALMSASPGGGGGVRALIHLRAILASLGADVLSYQLSVSCAQDAFNEQGQLTKPDVKKDLKLEIQQLML